jgi:hypothetical protein
MLFPSGETHPGRNLHSTMLRPYLRKLLLDQDEFMRLLQDG